MGFIESVTGEVFHEGEDFMGRLLGYSTLYCPTDKLVSILGHDFGLLFTHGLPEIISLVQGEPPQDVGYPHNLLLVEDNTVGLFQ